MENASKALIIAGAILISIILISIGVMVVNSGQQLVDTAGSKMSQQDLQAYNADYLGYIGQQRGSTVRSLIQTVQSNNSTNKDLQIKVTVESESKEGQEVASLITKVKPSSTYEASVNYSDAGRVNELVISKPSSI